MAAKSPVKEPQGTSAVNPTTPLAPAPVKPELPSSSEPDVVNVPSYSRWFSFDSISECEVKFLPEFFDSRSPSKNPRVYRYYRDSIVKHYRENPSRKITFTDVRRTLVGDVGSIRRVFDFLETWGLINYFASVKTLKWEDKETKSSAASAESSSALKETSKRLCNGCKTLCTIACFACDKYDLTLCARCYVRGNHRVGVSSSDFRRVEISEEARSDWTEKETLQLLEAIMHFGDDWRKVAQHVSGKSEKDCITHFIKLPFGQEFICKESDSEDVDNKFFSINNPSDAVSESENVGATSPSKRMRLTPLADASNPIMAQAAFLSALAGVQIAEVAARAAVTTLSDVDDRASKGSLIRNTRQQEAEVASNGDATQNALARASVDASSLIEKEELDVEKAISGIVEVQMKEIQDKIIRFESLDLQMEEEWKQLFRACALVTIQFQKFLNMATRQKLKGKLYHEENGEEEEKLKSAAAMSSDDEEGNEDLSLKIVEKHMLMRAAKLDQDDSDSDVVLNDNTNTNTSDNSNNKNGGVEAVVPGPSGTTDDVIIEDVKSSDKKRIRVRKKKKKEADKIEIEDQSVIVRKEEQKVETADNGDEGVTTVEISDNIVLRKLLRGPRYFDPPDRGWQTCYNCGEEGHMAVNCRSAVKRKKPCFVCGSLEHGVRQCSKAQDCFICKKGGHRAKDCPDKHKSGFQNAQVCLKCGDSGHDMFSCRNSYSLDDLKEVQCYICRSFGHLCCVNISDAVPGEVSCFRCGQLGHTGLACARSRGETVEASPSSCYKCGAEGHFARECVSSSKVRKRNIDTSTPTFRPHRENKDHSGIKSAPHDLGKVHKRKKTQHEERGIMTSRKSKQRGGWITDDPGDISYGKPKRNHWRSPGTPSSKAHKISAITSGGHFSSPQSSIKRNSHHRFSASRFDNSGSDGIRRGYDWW